MAAEVRMPERSLECMGLLASAWRGDWSSFDGRTLRAQLEELDMLIRSEVAGVEVDVDGFCEINGIDRATGSWKGV